MPLNLARSYALLRGRVEHDQSAEDLVAMGIRGGTYFATAFALRGMPFANVRPAARDEVESTVDLKRTQSALRRVAKQAYVAMFRMLDRTVCRWTGIPVAAFLPDLTFCLQKLPLGSGEGLALMPRAGGAST
jgi:hypothetical protein